MEHLPRPGRGLLLPEWYFLLAVTENFSRPAQGKRLHPLPEWYFLIPVTQQRFRRGRVGKAAPGPLRPTGFWILYLDRQETVGERSVGVWEYGCVGV